ncbi:unnamed protein product [Fusarium venenatum]|uniref:Uncharacterized protein n=1 Tax=Fusarium venenatum TaxID=56646 RepID=A0A2L2T9V2_9HYPO|nr:uncharacterized protein FVRRES_05513 [Fusarium venenatum]CEI61077.1 unnamed protein product [Fusarium venenatum]
MPLLEVRLPLGDEEDYHLEDEEPRHDAEVEDHDNKDRDDIIKYRCYRCYPCLNRKGQEWRPKN